MNFIAYRPSEANLALSEYPELPCYHRHKHVTVAYLYFYMSGVWFDGHRVNTLQSYPAAHI